MRKQIRSSWSRTIWNSSQSLLFLKYSLPDERRIYVRGFEIARVCSRGRRDCDGRRSSASHSDGADRQAGLVPARRRDRAGTDSGRRASCRRPSARRRRLAWRPQTRRRLARRQWTWRRLAWTPPGGSPPCRSPTGGGSSARGPPSRRSPASWSPARRRASAGWRRLGASLLLGARRGDRFRHRSDRRGLGLCAAAAGPLLVLYRSEPSERFLGHLSALMMKLEA